MTGAGSSGIGVHVAPDRSTAELVLPAGPDRGAVSAAVCEAILREAGVEVTAFTHEAVEGLLQQGADAAHAARAIVARATPPRHGEDGRIEWLVKPPAPPAPPTGAAPDGQEPAPDPAAGRRSYYDCSAFVMVKPGEVIGQIHRPTFGEDGRDVTGKTLVARRGKEPPLTLDDSILCDASGRLVAQAEGVLIRTATTACIREVLDIREYVDFSTGNIDFHGDVKVGKGVRDLFTIRATGSVEVGGLIGAATIVAGGNLVARGGFAGRERGRAEVGGDFLGKYVDNVEGEVRGDLAIDREVVNAHLVIHGGVNMPHGAILGGRVVATGRVHVGTLGSGGGVATEIVIGGVPRLEPLHTDLRNFVDRIQTRRDEVAAQQKQLDDLAGKKRATSIDKERQTELIFELSNLDSMLRKATPTSEALAARIDSLRTVELTVERRVFPGTVIVLGHQRFQVTSELRGPVRIARDASGALAYFHGEDRVGLLVQVADLHAA